MAVGKKERVTKNISGTVNETTAIIARVLNYARITVFGKVTITGTYTVNIKVYGTYDADASSPVWKQIGSTQQFTSTGLLTPEDIVQCWDAIKVTYDGSGDGSAVVDLAINRKRH